MNNKHFFKSRNGKLVVLSGTSAALMSAGSAHADMAASITSAFATATTNIGSAATGVIALAAIVTGIGLIYRLLAR
jgi:uncharacterized membrane protein